MQRAIHTFLLVGRSRRRRGASRGSKACLHQHQRRPARAAAAAAHLPSSRHSPPGCVGAQPRARGRAVCRATHCLGFAYYARTALIPALPAFPVSAAPPRGAFVGHTPSPPPPFFSRPRRRAHPPLPQPTPLQGSTCAPCSRNPHLLSRRADRPTHPFAPSARAHPTDELDNPHLLCCFHPVVFALLQPACLSGNQRPP
ncbi:MAG: hypothetical protein J3K34DRAFT_404508 [Monoraphidium minutum]|nr:MAG: hypothetical protein J3K34DRAFT_404508 [Monoraphidium minutum]